MSDTTTLTTIDPSPPPADLVSAESEAQEGETLPQPSPPTAETPEPGKLDLARQIEKAARSASRARQEAQQVARERHAFQQERQAFQAEREALAKERESFKQDVDHFQSDPVEYDLRKGRDPVEAVKRYTTPETTVERELKALKVQLKAESEAREQREEAVREEQEQRRAQEERMSFFQGFTGSITPDVCPNLVTLYPNANSIPGLMQEMLNEKNGDGETLLERFRSEHRRNPSHQEIRNALEQRAAVRAKSLYDGLRKIYESSPQSDSEANAASASTSGPQGISNQHAGKVISQNGQKKLSFEERRALNLLAFKNQLAADSE